MRSAGQNTEVVERGSQVHADHGDRLLAAAQESLLYKARSLQPPRLVAGLVKRFDLGEHERVQMSTRTCALYRRKKEAQHKRLQRQKFLPLARDEFDRIREKNI